MIVPDSIHEIHGCWLPQIASSMFSSASFAVHRFHLGDHMAANEQKGTSDHVALREDSKENEKILLAQFFWRPFAIRVESLHSSLVHQTQGNYDCP